MAKTHNQLTAEYNRRHDNIMVRPSKELGERIRATAAEEGKSVQRFLIDCAEEHGLVEVQKSAES